MSEKPMKLSQARIRPAFGQRLSPPVVESDMQMQAGVDSKPEERLKGPSARTWGLLMIVLSGIIWASAAVVGFQTALTMQLGLGYFMAVIGILFPALGLFSIAILSGLNPLVVVFLVTGGILRFNTLNYLLLIIMALNIPFILRLRDLNSRALQVLILLMTLELALSQNLREGMDDILNLATTFGVVIFFARAAKDELSFYWLGLVNGFVGAVIGLVFFIQFEQLPYSNPNNWTYLQLTALFSICFAMYFANKHRKNKLPLLFLAIINFTWIFLSGSRGSLLIAALCAVYLFLATRSISWSTVMVAMAILVGLWVSTRFVEQQVSAVTRIQLLFNENVSEATRTSNRSELMRAGLELFRKNPLGIGTGNFRVRAAETGYVSRSQPAHSGWIKVMVENGVPGAILLAAFVGSFAVAGFKGHSKGQGLLLLGIFLSAIFATAFIAKEFQERALWFLAAGGIVLLRPSEILELLNRRSKPYDTDYRRRLREVRFGRRK